MNLPGRAEGNWGWRVRSEALTNDVAERLAELTELAGRRALATVCTVLFGTSRRIAGRLDVVLIDV